MASLAASPAALADFLEALRLPPGADLLGPVPEPPRPGQDGERERYLVRVQRGEGLALAHALTEVQGVRSAKKVGEHVRVQLDPLDLV
jgi:primosomal protein N' (replication factor Y)